MVKLKENIENGRLRKFIRVLFLPLFVASSMSLSAAYAVDSSAVPLIKVVTVTYHPNVAYGGLVMYGYAVTNPGVVPLSNVTITDNKCQPITIAFGDTNKNALLDPGESWMYACTTFLTIDTVNTATVTGTGNGITATASASASVTVGPPPVTPVTPPVIPSPTPKLPNTGI